MNQTVKRLMFNWLESRGYEVTIPLQDFERDSRRGFLEKKDDNKRRYATFDRAYKLQLAAQLDEKYKNRAVVGKVRVYDALAALAPVIDPYNPNLGCVSQLVHVLQVATYMEQDGQPEKLVLCGLVHDIGKLMLLQPDEDPMNVEAGGRKELLAGTPGGGLLNCTFRWDHGDFGYMRLKDHVDPDMAWLLRHHSVDIAAYGEYMNDYDREQNERLLQPFNYYDEHCNIYGIPKPLEHFRDLIDRAFPEEILV